MDNVIQRFFEPRQRSYFLFGPRGSGKTSWVNASYPDALMIDLLNPGVYRELKAKPELLIQ